MRLVRTPVLARRSRDVRRAPARLAFGQARDHRRPPRVEAPRTAVAAGLRTGRSASRGPDPPGAGRAGARQGRTAQRLRGDASARAMRGRSQRARRDRVGRWSRRCGGAVGAGQLEKRATRDRRRHPTATAPATRPAPAATGYEGRRARPTTSTRTTIDPDQRRAAPTRPRSAESTASARASGLWRAGSVARRDSKM